MLILYDFHRIINSFNLYVSANWPNIFVFTIRKETKKKLLLKQILLKIWIYGFVTFFCTFKYMINTNSASNISKSFYFCLSLSLSLSKMWNINQMFIERIKHIDVPLVNLIRQLLNTSLWKKHAHVQIICEGTYLLQLPTPHPLPQQANPNHPVRKTNLDQHI